MAATGSIAPPGPVPQPAPKRRRRGLGVFALLLPAVFLMAVSYIVPLGTLVIDSFHDKGAFTLDIYRQVLSQDYYWPALVSTFQISAWVTLLSLLLGFPLAYYVTFIAKRRITRRLIFFIIIIPLFTSNIVRSFGWIVLLGRRGIVNEGLVGSGLVSSPVAILYSPTAIIIGLVYIMLPMMTLTIASVLQGIDRRLHEASFDLGAGHFRTLRDITLPLSRPGIIAGCLIVFTLTQSAYVIPSVLGGGKVSVLQVLIYQQFASTTDYRIGAALSVVLFTSTLLLVAAALAIVNRGATHGGRAGQ